MKLIKKILIKVLMLIVLLFAVNLTYEHTLWNADRSKYADVLDSLNTIVDSTDVLYLASSSNYFHPLSDTVGYTISGFIDDQFPNLRVNSVCKGYMHAGAFYSVLKNIPKNSPIKTIVVSVNMRSFGAYWVYSDSETAFSQMELMMNNDYPLIFRKFLLSLDYYDNKTVEERRQQYLNSWRNDTLNITKYNFKKTTFDWDSISSLSSRYKDINYRNDYDKVGFMCNIIKAFAYNLDTINNIRFKQFDKIVDLAMSRNWNLIFNILPEDIDKANIMVGNEIPYILRKNRDVFVDKYKKQKVTIVDNMELLNGKYFFEYYPTEHYTTIGKRVLSNSVSKVISNFYPNKQFKEDNIDINGNIKQIKPYIIYENGEVLNVNKRYSNSLKYKSIDVAKSNFDSVKVSFITENKVINDSLYLVVEYYNEKRTYYWKSYKLNEFLHNNSTFSNKIELPEILDTDDEIKIYIWNNSVDSLELRRLSIVAF